MAIKYYLQPNAVTPDPNDQSARVLPNMVHDTESIIKEVLKRGSTLTESDIRAVLTMLFKVICDELAEGNFVNLPIGNFRCGINGVFTNVGDSFDPSRHAVKSTISAGNLLWDAMAAAKVEKITQPVVSPYILQFEDVNSSTTNSIATKGGIAVIIGEELKFNPANAAEGIFFVNATGTATKVSVIAKRTEGNLTFSIPATLVAGAYTLEVRRGYTQANTIRIGTLADKLIVA